MDLSSIELESDVGRTIIKAIEDPDNLSAEDKFKMNSWLNAVVSIYEYNNQAEALGIGPSLLPYVEDDARFYFASRYARQWFEGNRRWIAPAAADAISRTIESVPVPTSWDEVSVVYGETDEN